MLVVYGEVGSCFVFVGVRDVCIWLGVGGLHGGGGKG